MALTKEALLLRRQGIGGSDAAKIMGTDEDWYKLWLDKTGRSEPEDLSGVWPVQLGTVTEELNLDWYERKTGRPVTMRGAVVICGQHPILRCTLDGLDEAVPAVLQAKHVNAFSKIEEVTARYSWQVLHEMITCEVPNGFLSVIVGAAEPVLVPIEYDDFTAGMYIDRRRVLGLRRERRGAGQLCASAGCADRAGEDAHGRHDRQHLWADLAGKS